jgi:hypothetical protein
MARERAQVPVVERRVGVLLRVDDPHDEVRQLQHPLELRAVRGRDRVEVREVEHDEALRVVAVDVVAARDLEPVEQRLRAVTPHRGGRRRGGRPPRRRA